MKKMGLLFLSVLVFAGCGANAKLTFNKPDNCAALGGTVLSTGGCLIPCMTDSECSKKGEGLEECVGYWNIWTYNYCYPLECEGLTGWIQGGARCFLECSGEDDTTTCPSGYTCVEYTGSENDKKEYYCSGYEYSHPSGGDCAYCSPGSCAGKCQFCSSCTNYTF